jgi:hypothetical protein
MYAKVSAPGTTDEAEERIVRARGGAPESEHRQPGTRLP